MSCEKNGSHIDLRPSPKKCTVYPTPTESFNIYPNVQTATQILTKISKISSTQTCLSKEEVKISCPKTEAGLYLHILKTE